MLSILYSSSTIFTAVFGKTLQNTTSLTRRPGAAFLP
jgi:hypothetical protein